MSSSAILLYVKHAACKLNSVLSKEVISFTLHKLLLASAALHTVNKFVC